MIKIFKCNCGHENPYHEFYLSLRNLKDYPLRCEKCRRTGLKFIGTGKDVKRIVFRNPVTNELEKSLEIGTVMKPHDREKMRGNKRDWLRELEAGLLGRTGKKKKANRMSRGMNKSYWKNGIFTPKERYNYD